MKGKNIFYLIIAMIALAGINGELISQTISGRITNSKEEPLPFANIFCVELNTGTTSNLDGNFIFKVLPGQRVIIISYVGYKSDTVSVNLKKSDEIKKNIVLQEKAAEMQTVYVFDSSMSEAERIISRTITSKNDYLSKIRNYEYNSYNKTVIRATYKDTLLIAGILETQTKAYCKYPDYFNEVILAKRQTKNFSSMSNIFTLGKAPNALDEEIAIDEVSVVSPLNTNALNYYLYRLIDTTYYNNRKVFQIHFEPKVKFIPLFEGEIGIIDSLYVPVSLKLLGGDNIITSGRKAIEINEKFAEFNNEFWLPIWVEQNFTFNFDFPLLPKIYAEQISLLSSYEINSDHFDRLFTKNILEENLIPEEETPKFWKENQQIILTDDEKKAAAKIDSVVENGSFLQKSAFWLSKNLYGINSLPITSFNDFYHFNRAEGHYAGFGFKFNNIFKNTNLSLISGYGFSDKKLKYGFEVDHSLGNISGSVNFFNRVNKLDHFYTYSDFDLTFQSWFEKNDYADYYYSKGIEGWLNYNINDDISAGIGISKRRDLSAYITSDWSLLNRKTIYRPLPNIDEGNITTYSLKLSYDNKNYYDLGFAKIPDRSKNYFDMELLVTGGNYSNGISGFFRQVHLAMNTCRRFSSLLNVTVGSLAGYNSGFEIKQNMFHFPGNYGTFSSINRFNTLKKDEYVGPKYLCFFLENNFSNVIYKFLQLPYLKNTKYDFIIFGKYGWIDEEPLRHASKYFYETGFGVDNILAFLRIDFSWRLQPHSKSIFYIDIVSKVDI